MNWLLSPGGRYRRGRAAAAIGSSYPKDKGLPNTLCHIALQMPAHRAAFSDKVLPWVVAGCIIPDIPGSCSGRHLPSIWRRHTRSGSTPPSRPVSSSAPFFRPSWPSSSRHPAATFAILTGNSLLHLLLDATQVKWANGVHLLAPFDWSAWQFNLFDIDHPLGIPLTIAGLITLLWSWPTSCAGRSGPPPRTWPDCRRCDLYLTLPDRSALFSRRSRTNRFSLSPIPSKTRPPAPENILNSIVSPMIGRRRPSPFSAAKQSDWRERCRTVPDQSRSGADSSPRIMWQSLTTGCTAGSGIRPRCWEFFWLVF